MAIVTRQGKKKLICDPGASGGCTDPEIKRGKDRCHSGDPIKGHTAKEMEKHREELDGFYKLSGTDQSNVVKPEDQPRTPGQIYDQVIDENS